MDITRQELKDLAAISLARMEICQSHVERIERIVNHSRSKDHPLERGSLERSADYWRNEFAEAFRKHIAARASLEDLLVGKDRLDK